MSSTQNLVYMQTELSTQSLPLITIFLQGLPPQISFTRQKQKPILQTPDSCKSYLLLSCCEEPETDSRDWFRNATRYKNECTTDNRQKTCCFPENPPKSHPSEIWRNIYQARVYYSIYTSLPFLKSKRNPSVAVNFRALDHIFFYYQITQLLRLSSHFWYSECICESKKETTSSS